MFKVIAGEIYSVTELVKYLNQIGIDNTSEIINIIKKRRFGIVGQTRIVYLPN
jgi:hypothetical protein